MESLGNITVPNSVSSLQSAAHRNPTVPARSYESLISMYLPWFEIRRILSAFGKYQFIDPAGETDG